MAIRGGHRWLLALTAALALLLVAVVSLANAATISAGPTLHQLDEIAAGDGQLWAQLRSGGGLGGLASGGFVQDLDPQSGQPVGAKIALSGQLLLEGPVMAVGAGQVWVAEVIGSSGPPQGYSRLWEINERTRQKLTIKLPNLGTPRDMILASGSLWILEGRGGGNALLQINVAHPTQTRRIVLPAGLPAPDVVDSGGALWTTLTQDNQTTLLRVNPTSGSITTQMLTLTGPPLGLAAGDGAMWLASGGGRNGDAVLTELGASSGAVTATVPLETPPPHGTGFNRGGITVAPHTIWVVPTNEADIYPPQTGTLVGVDPTTHAIVQTALALPADVAGAGLTPAVAGDSLWLPGRNRLWRVPADPG